MAKPRLAPERIPALREGGKRGLAGLGLVVLAQTKPQTIQEALASPDAHEWLIAVESELESLQINGTWTLVDRPPGFKAITVRWLFQRKRNPDGSVERFKARLVAQGFKEVEGRNYDEVYAPVSSYSTFRVFLALVAKYGMVCENLDVKTAFLQGELAETVYITQPPGYHQGSTKTVCLLVMSMTCLSL